MENLRPIMEAWSRELAQALEMMTGSPAQVVPEASSGGKADLWWEHTFSPEPGLKLAVGADNDTWLAAATAILQAAGIDTVETGEARSTWIEILDQAASGTARKLGAGAARPVECGPGHQVSEPGPGGTFRVTLGLDGGGLAIWLVISPQENRAVKPEPAKQTAATAAAAAAASPAPAPAMSRTMEALLDVHLPVSISFGHAKVPLRDVLKLTTGTVVELNKQPDDPVEIIVNDCVIARGEVVVVDGNYAVRIQSITGRQNRLNLRPDGTEQEIGKR